MLIVQFAYQFVSQCLPLTSELRLGSTKQSWSLQVAVFCPNCSRHRLNLVLLLQESRKNSAFTSGGWLLAASWQCGLQDTAHSYSHPPGTAQGHNMQEPRDGEMVLQGHQEKTEPVLGEGLETLQMGLGAWGKQWGAWGWVGDHSCEESKHGHKPHICSAYKCVGISA